MVAGDPIMLTDDERWPFNDYVVHLEVRVNGQRSAENAITKAKAPFSGWPQRDVNVGTVERLPRKP